MKEKQEFAAQPIQQRLQEMQDLWMSVDVEQLSAMGCDAMDLVGPLRDIHPALESQARP